MYLISAYFDEKADKIIERYICQIAEKMGNTFMTDNHVPPHLTGFSVESRSGALLIPFVEKLHKYLSQGVIEVVSVGMLLPYVMYLTPILNAYLQNLSQQIFASVSGISEVSVSRFYQPMKWLPHITLEKKLGKEQMQIAFEVMQESFVLFEATILKF